MADVTYREALRRALDEELGRDDKVFLMGEEIGRFEGSYKVTAGLWEKYGPRRVRETPISEGGFVGAGIGAANLEGRRHSRKPEACGTIAAQRNCKKSVS